jgi:hypothetical protein
MQEEVEVSKKTQNFQISSEGLIPVNQLKDFIVGMIKDKYEGGSKSIFTKNQRYEDSSWISAIKTSII